MDINIETLFDLSKIDLNDGDHKLTLIDGTNIDIELYNLGNVEYDISPVLGSNRQDGPMLVLKYEQLIIDNNVIITPSIRRKGMCIFAKRIINNGIITMTARGANAIGDDIYLYKNDNNTYEIVPAIGANGADRYNGWGVSITYPGITGGHGVNRQTGGGGSGGSGRSDTSTGYGYPGKGGNGTSYSGGSGGGAAWAYRGAARAGDGHNYGGPGGQGVSTYGNQRPTGGGAGNPGGVSQSGGHKGQDGTGGLLIIYANDFVNSGIINSNGMEGGNGNNGSGGSSGGGSINIFYESESTFLQGKVNASGGISNWRGAAGGNGCITFNKVSFSVQKYFFNVDNKLKYLNENNELITLNHDINNVTPNDFYDYGMSDIEYNTELIDIDKLSLCIYSSDKKLKYIGLLKNTFIENIKFIDFPHNQSIYKMKITDHKQNNIIKYIFCINNEWYYFSNSEWKKINTLNIKELIGNSSEEINSFSEQVWIDFNKIYLENNLEDRKLKIGCIIANNNENPPLISKIEVWSFNNSKLLDISSNNYTITNYYNKYELLWNGDKKDKIQIQYE